MECIYNDNYLIYNDGRVYNHKYDRWLEGWINQDGYRRFILSGKRYFGHRLVAIHYIDNPQNLPEVDHIDGNKLNNDVSNLRWLSHADNTNAYNKLRSDNTSGFKNISWCNTYKKWDFQKKIYGKRICKRFNSINDALWFKFVILLTHNLQK